MPLRLCSVTIRQPEVNVLEFVYGGLLGNTSQEDCVALVRGVMRSLAEGDAHLALWEQLDARSALYTCATQLPSMIVQLVGPLQAIDITCISFFAKSVSR